jgi:hypothetical protein
VYKEIGAIHSTKHAKCCITTFIMWIKCRVRDFKVGALRSNFKWFVYLKILHYYLINCSLTLHIYFFRYASSLRDLEWPVECWQNFLPLFPQVWPIQCGI